MVFYGWMVDVKRGSVRNILNIPISTSITEWCPCYTLYTQYPKHQLTVFTVHTVLTGSRVVTVPKVILIPRNPPHPDYPIGFGYLPSLYLKVALDTPILPLSVYCYIYTAPKRQIHIHDIICIETLERNPL